jgi:hypothetical protein
MGGAFFVCRLSVGQHQCPHLTQSYVHKRAQPAVSKVLASVGLRVETRANPKASGAMDHRLSGFAVPTAGIPSLVGPAGRFWHRLLAPRVWKPMREMAHARFFCVTCLSAETLESFYFVSFRYFVPSRGGDGSDVI